MSLLVIEGYAELMPRRLGLGGWGLRLAVPRVRSYSIEGGSVDSRCRGEDLRRGRLDGLHSGIGNTFYVCSGRPLRPVC